MDEYGRRVVIYFLPPCFSSFHHSRGARIAPPGPESLRAPPADL